MSFNLSSDLLYTYGVVERIRNILSSGVLKEIEAQGSGFVKKHEPQELESIFSDLSVAFPKIYRNISEYQETLGDEKGRYETECHLDNLRRAAYEIEDMLDAASTGGKLLPPDEFVGLKSSLRSTLFNLEEISGALGAPYKSEVRRRFPAFRYITPNLHKAAGCRERVADKLFVPPAFLSSATKATDTSSHYHRLWCWEDTVVGRVLEKIQIVNWIFNPSNQDHPNVISITGAAGRGKTTLAKMVYNDVQVSNRFDLVLWAMAPRRKGFSLDIKSTIVEIVRSYTRESWYLLQRTDTGTLKARLRGILKDRRYLLVVDDFMITKSTEWQELREILEVGSTGSAVIVTTKSRWVVQQMRCAQGFKLKVLPKNDRWSLFTRCAGFDDGADKADQEYPLLKIIGRSIVSKCGGSPLATKTLGSMLADNRDEHTWKQKVERRIRTEFTPAREALRISFQNMFCDLAQCFVGSAILPQNKAMSRDQLVYFWMAQGLLKSSDQGNEDPRDIGYRYCNELLLRAFLQLHEINGREIFQMHHEVRSFALRVMRREGSPIPGASFLENHRHFIWNVDDQTSLEEGFAPDHLTLRNARTFLFQNYVGPVKKPFLEGLISKLQRARVLLLDGSEFEELPECVGDLKLLRYLSLAENHKLKMLPESICKLLKLQTLDLSGCQQLQTLPRYMPSLKHLFLSVKLNNLPEEALKNWPSLHHLKICNCPNLKSISYGILHLTALQVLQIHDCPLIGSLPDSIIGLAYLKELSIQYCENLDLTNWVGLYGLRSLQFLQFQGLPKLNKFPEGLLSGADSLRHLIVGNCENLTTLPDCKNLLEISIDGCPSIITLSKGIHEIKTLQVLKIVNCPNLIARCQSGIGGDWHLISHVPKIQLQHQVIRPTLKKHPGLLSLLYSNQSKIRLQLQSPRKALKEKVLDSIELQGEDLPPKIGAMKEMKAYCSILLLLPELDYEIEKDTLIQLWMAEEYMKGEPMELQGEKPFSFILNNGYLLHSGTNLMTGKDTYRLNISKINELLDSQKEYGSFYLKWEDGYLEKSRPTELIQHVSVVCNDIDANIFKTLQQFNNLRTLLFLGNHVHRVKSIPDKLFLCLKNIRSLDLSKTHIRELPSSVENMIHLRYLNLSWTRIKRLPSMICCSLKKLQTLKLKGCSKLHELPAQLNMLTKLRHLDADVLHQLETMPKGIGSLVNLRTLSAYLVGTEDGCKIDQLEGLNNLAGSFCIAKLENVENAEEAKHACLYKKEYLTKLELRWTASELSGAHNNSHAILECLESYTSLEELQILCYEGSTFPSWVSNPKFYKLAHITFYKCDYVIELPPIEQLPFLKHLELVKVNSVKKIELQENLEKDVAFPKLEKLEIDEMRSLEGWVWKKRNEGDFTRLIELTINDCPELEKFDVISQLSAIKHLEIRECPKLQSLSDTKLPESLEELVIEDCPDVQKKCSEQGGEDWHKIEHVPIKSIERVDEDDDDDDSDGEGDTDDETGTND